MKTIVTLLMLLSFLSACSAEEPQPDDFYEWRGVWLTNVDSDVLDSRENIAGAMDFLAQHNFNVVYPVVWNDARTLYPSAVMDSLFGLPIDSAYAGRDPLAEVVEEAHKRGIAVIAWFEYGFAASHEKGGGHILRTFPEWAALDAEGNLLTKNGFEWMNAFHPDVQSLLLSLVQEVVRNYNVDGVQGDDRLPAIPSEGGYSPYTRALYESETGEEPPRDHHDPEWLRWRAARLNDFGRRLYDGVRDIKPQVWVSWSPSIYPWSYQEYLQVWPDWLHGGYADVINPQCYRYTLDGYEETLQAFRSDSVGLNEDDLHIIYPGILMNVGEYVIEEDMLLDKVRLNRSFGFNGEVFFFYEGLRKKNNLLAKALLNGPYKTKARLPHSPAFLRR